MRIYQDQETQALVFEHYRRFSNAITRVNYGIAWRISWNDVSWGAEKRYKHPMGPTDILTAQGIYYLFTGIWPVVHIRSFLAVTGPKTDLWLVRTVGLLIAVAGAAMMQAGISDEPTLAMLILAAGSAAALAAVDIIYVALGTISKIYLLDAALEIALLLAWAAALLRAG